MKCPRCQLETPSDAEFCPECGAKLGGICAGCGTENALGHKFCKKCGQSLTSSGPGPTRGPDAAKFASPESYTPKHLAEKILTSKSALEGERKQVTVLFADLKGSMELLADRDPEEARKLLDPVLERMMEAVHHYEGTVNQVMGDGIMALFGAPLAHEDHAVRACYTALRMQDTIRRYSDELRRTEGARVQIRVGLNSGEVVVRAIGSDLHMDYTAVGQTTHLAARMEQLATPGSILLTADTLRLAEGYVQVTPLGPTPVKGLIEPVEVYEVTGAGPVRTRFQAAAARGLTRFVGRDAELDQLRRALQLAADGHGQVAAVVGEAGVGKSRLLYEFTHSHRTQGWLILESGSVSYGKATSYLPVIDLLRAYFKIQDRDDHRDIREKVIGKLLALDRSLEPLLSAFLALLEVPVQDAEWQTLDPPERRQRTLGAVKRLLLGESHVQPLMLIFEDLHWIDSETQAVLDSLVDSLAPAQLLLLVSFRPEYQHGWAGKTFYSQVRLDMLAPECAEEMLQVLLGADPGLEPLKKLLVRRGNPFFLEECIRTLVEAKALAGARGAYRLVQPIQAIQVPATVQSVLATRIDRLPVEEKQLLQAASVVGKDVLYALLQAVAELPEEALRRGLTHLQAAEFLYETSLFPDLEYTFKHALTHEVTYTSVLQQRRRTLHARIVDAIERLYPDRLAEHVERLAHHAVRGEVWDKAVLYLRQAGAKAFDRSATREAVGSFEQALRALKQMSESCASMQLGVDLRLDLRASLLALGEISRVFDYLHEAERLADALGDQPRLGRVSGSLAQSYMVIGDYDHAVESGTRAHAIAEVSGDLGAGLLANFNLGQAYFFLGDYQRALEFFRHTIESVESNLIYRRFGMAGLPSVTGRAWLAMSLAELGQFVDADTYGAAGMRIAEEVKHAFTQIVADRGLGHLYLRRGDLPQAVRVLERGLMLSESTGVHILVPSIASYLGTAYALSGRLPQATSLLKHAMDAFFSMNVVFDRSQCLGWLSEAYLLAGRIDEGLELANRAFDLSRGHGERGHEAWILRLLGEINSRRERPAVETAEDFYRQSCALAQDLGMRPLVAHCHLGLGKLYRRTGQREQAQQHLTTATTMYREMDMGFWMEKAEAETSELA